MTRAVERALGVGTVGVRVAVVRKMFVLGTDLMREAFVNICSNMLQCRSYKPVLQWNFSSWQWHPYKDVRSLLLRFWDMRLKIFSCMGV